MAKPEAVGLSASRLGRLETLLKQRYVDTGLLPGTLTMICRGGEIAHTAVNGMMDIARAKPMREDAIFRIYSMSKPITVVALMMLIEAGKLALDDEVCQHIPRFADLRVYVGQIPSFTENTEGQFLTRPLKRPMKVIDLLTHTAGFTYGFLMRTTVDAAYRQQKIGDGQTPGGLAGFIKQLAALPLEFSPGEYWNYSVSIDVVGYLVEKLSGMRFGEFLHTQLFAPLGMTDTGFFVPPDKLERFAACYMPAQGGGLRLQDDVEKSPFAAPPALESGGGGLVSTAQDYMRFCRMMLGGGTLDGVQILSPKTVELFSMNFLPGGKTLSDLVAAEGMFSEAGYRGIGFSLGCGVTLDVTKTGVPGSAGEYFWGGAAATAFWIDPKEDLAVVFMTQVLGSQARLTLRRDLRTLIYSAFTTARPAPSC